MRTRLALAALALGTAIAAPAHAGTVIIQPITDNARLTSVRLSFDSGANFADSLAGQLKIRRTGGTDTLITATEFFTFCVEPTEFLNAVIMDVVGVQFGDTAQGGMGLAKKNDVEQLLERFAPNLHLAVDDTKGAAIQLALWEIVRETSGTYDLTAGIFQATAPAAVLGLSQSYLAALTPDGPELGNLVALINRGNQDLLAQVPTPASLALFGLGLAAIAAGRRRA